MKTKNFFYWLGLKIARTMLFIKATTYRKEPYKWASGMMMHIYNDNRMLLAHYKHRMRVALGFVHKFKQYGIEPDYILGTFMSGIAPAASVAQKLGKQLIIRDSGNFYLYEKNLVNMMTFCQMKGCLVDAIVSIGPEMIPYGVQYANKIQKGFAYMRPSSKSHGKEQQIEGDLKSNSRIIVIQKFGTENDKSLIEKLTSIGHEIVHIYTMGDQHFFIEKEHLQGKIIPVIEDLFSTGGSSAEEVFYLREAGAISNYCFSIFSYGFDILKKQFLGRSKIGNTGLQFEKTCITDSLLPFSVLATEMERLNFWTKDTRESMIEEINNFDQNYASFLEKQTSV